MSNKTVKLNKSRSLLKKQFNPGIDSDDNAILELQRKTLKLIPSKFKIKYSRNIQSVSPPVRFSVEVEVEKCDTDDTIQNVFNATSSGQEAHGTNVIEVHEKRAEKQPSNNKEKVFYIRQIFLEETRKEKNYTIVKQYTITKETIMKAIEEQSKENTEESDRCLDIFSRNLHGHFGNITLSYYDEEVNTIMRVWGQWYRLYPSFRGTPLIYKCYICCKGWWRLHPFKEHLKEHNDPHLKLGPEPIHDEFNVIAYIKQELKIKIVKMDSDCWKCGRGAAFHQHSYSLSEKYKCPGCNKCMTTCTVLKEHESLCINNIKLNLKKYNVEINKGLMCPICKIYCIQEQVLDNHMVDYHLVRSDEPIALETKECKFCGGRYINSKFHDCPASTKSYKCDVCCRSFSLLIILQIHMEYSRGHAVKCTVCGKHVPQCMVPEHYLKHSKNYCLVYMCGKCDTDLLFTNYKTYLTHGKIHSRRHRSRQMLLPTKCLNGEFAKCETTFRIPDVKLDGFLADIVDNNGIPTDVETTRHREEIPCRTHELTTPNMAAGDGDSDVIVLDDDDDVKPAREAALNSETIKFDIKAMQTQLDEEIMRELEVEATICKVFQASKGYRLLMQKESLERKPEEDRLLKEKSKTKDLIEKESINKELLKIGSIEELIPEESISNEIQEIEKEEDIHQFDLIILDHDMEDVTIISDCEGEITPEDHSLNEIKYDSMAKKQEFNITKGSLESNKEKPVDIVTDCNSSDPKQNSNVRVTCTIVNEESLINNDAIVVEPEVAQEKSTLESSKDLKRKVYEDMLQIIANNKNTTNTESDNQLYECNRCNYTGMWDCYIMHVSTECLGTEFNCNLCNRFVIYRNLNDYLKHLTKHDCKPLACPQCRVQHKSQDELHTHVWSHIQNLFSGTKPTELQEMPTYCCNKCGISLQIEHFFKHWQAHLTGLCSGSTDEDNPSEFNSVLNKSFRPEFIKEIMKILQLKTKKRPISDCIVCSRTFHRWDDLKRHLIEHLMVQATFNRNSMRNGMLMCFFCEEGFQVKFDWRCHMRAHSHMRQYKCELCSKCFSDSSNYTKHRKVHNLFSYECDVCGSKYNMRRYLIEHLKLHEKPMSCKVCDMTFVSKAKLKKHVWDKHSAKYNCWICAEEFMTWREQQTHMWHKHDKRKVTADCPICDRRFRRMLDIKTHMKLKHKTSCRNMCIGRTLMCQVNQTETNVSSEPDRN